ncbi:MAG: 2-hydroxyacyl-CoA dehydratase family protein [Atopobiaceae bacterium]|jgi:benzoyl-CoA reductase/2-hydroxyglutaryl-CoA dehydratase subunit BcrC/BadD/HgdB|nr:2-hydroxyacyl-CoA dehydratase family protein [Atopobiaceae bacterium]
MDERSSDKSQAMLDWYGDVVGAHIKSSPSFARSWLSFGFAWTRWRTAHVQDHRLYPCGNYAARICFDMVSQAFSRTHELVLSSIFLPTEIFQALDLPAVTAEALAGTTGGAHAERGFVSYAEESGIPETYCSYHKVLIGMALSGVLEKPRMLASCSVACDANNLTFKTLAKLWDVPSVYIDVPYEISEDSIMYVADELRGLAGKAEEVFGRKIDQARLSGLVARSQHTLDTLSRSLTKRAGHYLKSDMMLAVEELLDAHVALGSPGAEQMAAHMVEDYAGAAPYEGLSLVWVHTAPFFLPELSQHLDRSPQAQIVATDMLFDQVCGEDGPWRHDGAQRPFEAMAERLVRCSFNGPATRRAERIRWICEQTHADGAVIFCHWGCKETAGAAQLIRHILERAGFPALVLDGDGCDRKNNMCGQMSTRFEAFLELLRLRHETC